MIDKCKIIESWIMVEHLSEGDIRLNDKALFNLDHLQGMDFYSFFLHEIKKENGMSGKMGELLFILVFSNFRK